MNSRWFRGNLAMDIDDVLEADAPGEAVGAAERIGHEPAAARTT
jgi:hypothetical protein